MSALTASDLAHWQAYGYLPPFRALARERVAGLSEAFAQAWDGGVPMNRHFDLVPIAAICREADVWDRAESLLGPDLLLWRTNLFLGNPTIEWHEDQHARLLNGGFGLSALVALVDGDAGNCTLVAPGSHRLDPAAKAAHYGLVAEPRGGGNVRYGGMVADDAFRRTPLLAGECLMFHPALLHASSGSLGGSGQTPRQSLVLRITPAGTVVSGDAYAAAAGPDAAPVLMRGRARAGARSGRLA